MDRLAFQGAIDQRQADRASYIHPLANGKGGSTPAQAYLMNPALRGRMSEISGKTMMIKSPITSVTA